MNNIAEHTKMIAYHLRAITILLCQDFVKNNPMEYKSMFAIIFLGTYDNMQIMTVPTGLD